MRRDFTCPSCGFRLDAMVPYETCPRCRRDLPTAFVQDELLARPQHAGQEIPGPVPVSAPVVRPRMQRAKKRLPTAPQKRTGLFAGFMVVLLVYGAGTAAYAYLDADGDGWATYTELRHGTLPWSADSDGDGLPDSWEASVGLDPKHADSDGDGVADGLELDQGTNPLRADSDGDGIPDGQDGSTAGASCPGDERCLMADPPSPTPDRTPFFFLVLSVAALALGAAASIVARTRPQPESNNA